MKNKSYVLIMVLIAFLIPLIFNSNEIQPIEANQGVLEMSSWDFYSDGIARIDGEWAVYYRQLLEPEDIQSAEPDAYADELAYFSALEIDGEPVPRANYASYHIKVNGNHMGELALKLGDICSSYKLYINGLPVASHGVVGTDSASSEGEYGPGVVQFSADGDIDLLFQVSTYNQPLVNEWNSVLIGTPEQIAALSNRAVAFEFFIVGSLMLMALLFLSAYLLGGRYIDKSALIIGCLSLDMLIGVLATGERMIRLLWPGISFNLMYSAEYLTLYTGIVLLLYFFDYCFDYIMNRTVKKVIRIVVVIECIIVIITSPALFGYLLLQMQLVMAVTLIYIFYVLLRAVGRGEYGAVELTAGYLVFVFFLLNDTLHSFGMINTGFYFGYGSVILIYVNSILIIVRYIKRHASSEKLNEEVVELNRTLEDKVSDRTRELLDMANRDSLTWLYNHKYIVNQIHSLSEERSSGEDTFSLLMLDIDFFKDVNDTYGHQAGDDVLVKLADYLEKNKRDSDVIGRYGGEEFIVILRGTSLDNAYKVAEKHRTAISKLIFNEPSIRITVSIGVAEYDGGEAEDLIKLVDQRLYKAKRSGRNISVVK